jgi:hypothetical protein
MSVHQITDAAFLCQELIGILPEQMIDGGGRDCDAAALDVDPRAFAISAHDRLGGDVPGISLRRFDAFGYRISLRRFDAFG